MGWLSHTKCTSSQTLIPAVNDAPCVQILELVTACIHGIVVRREAIEHPQADSPNTAKEGVYNVQVYSVQPSFFPIVFNAPGLVVAAPGSC